MKRLESVLHLIEDATSGDIPAVVEINSGVQGPTVGIIACTHGNEPVGLAAMEYLLSDLILKCGKLYFIVGNPKAASSYFWTDCDDAKEESRYIDANLNRLPDIEDVADSNIYEYQRAEELLPVLQSLDGVLDLHSTSSDAPEMLICADNNWLELTKSSLFSFGNVITNITNHISGKFIIDYCTNAELKVLAECGQHECLDAPQRAIDISLAFLQRMGLVECIKTSRRPVELSKYNVHMAVFLPKGCDDFRLFESIKAFEFIEEGQVIAKSDSGDIFKSPASGYAIMCPETENALDSSEALLFLCDKS